MNPLRALFVSLSRMPPAVMLVIIIVLAVVVTMMVQGQLGEKERLAKEQEAALKAKYEQKGKIVYAVKDIPEGATISAADLEEKEELTSRIPPDALASSSLAIGRIAKYGIPTGNIVSARDLAQTAAAVGFESKLKEGYRAVTFAVDANSGVAGFVNPGSHVDIVAVVGGGAQTKAHPILSDIEVVAVGSVYQRSPGATGSVPASSVTVSVAPGDANKLIKAIKAGSLYLTLRNDKDHSPVPVVDVASLFEKPAVPKTEVATLPPPSALPPPPLPGALGGPAAAPAPPPPPPLHEIEVWSGSKKEVLSVPKG
jgi:pilus assembly protein CpaB